jgi:molybdenum cofactor cytidylyltransferase
LNTGIVILAAGGSARLGQPKQLLQFEGESLLKRIARVALESSCDPVVVVLGAHADLCVVEVADLPLQIVQNENWVNGMASSIRAGLEALRAFAPHIDAVILLVCDQPHISAHLLDRLVSNCNSAETIVASQYADTLGVPALFTAAHFPELMNLRGDAGAKALFARHAGAVVAVPFPLGARDIDIPIDAASLRTADSDGRV